MEKLQVYLLRPSSSAQEHFEKLVNLLEQFVLRHFNAIIYFFPNSSQLFRVSNFLFYFEIFCCRYYHPSNGGRWTYSLERFLLHLVVTFQKRLQREQQ